MTTGNLIQRVEKLERSEGREVLLGWLDDDGLVDFDGRRMTQKDFENMAHEKGYEPLLVCWESEDDEEAEGLYQDD